MKYMTGKSHTDPSATPFALQVMQYMNDACRKWKEESDIDFSLYGTPLESTTYKFAKSLQRRFGIIEGVTDKSYITNSYHVHVTEDINAFEKAGTFTLMVDGQEAVLERTDVEIISEDIPGWLVANEGRLTVALDITVTEDLRKEGLARELVNRIQNLRKSSGFDITDKIHVSILSCEEMDEAIHDYKDYIANQVLAESIEIMDNAISDATELDFEDFKLSVKIEKA